MTEPEFRHGADAPGGALVGDAQSLTGLKVLDLSRILAGPWVGQTLADLGAEVIKIERPGAGDDTRGWGPPFLVDAQGRETADSAYFLCANRNKKSVTVDMTREEGRQALVALAQRADILIENYKLGGLKQYGLDYETLKKINPRLIYCSITGFGQTGPYASRAGYDFLIQGMGGLMSVTGVKDGDPGAGPQKVGVALTDIMTGLYSTVGILAALAYRERTGRGQHLDMALLDVQIAALANQGSNFLVSGKAPGRMGNAHPNIVPYQDFPTKDGYMVIAVGNDAQFTRLCEAAGRPEMVLDARFANNRARVMHRVQLIEALRALTIERTTAQWVETLEALGVPCGPINTIDQVFDDPHVQFRGVRQVVNSPIYGPVPIVANPIRMSETPVRYHSAPPVLGEHTREVLCGVLGMSSAEVDKLQAQGVF
jgi:crotonobetainyl-CoA:carnitine CoA-transferase CaiB-like acyl-CoA transferase